MDISKIFLIF